MRLTSLCQLLSCAAYVAARASYAQSPSADPPKRDTVHVSVVSSGGISLGAYQAGVNWALIEFMRASHRRDRKETWPLFELDALAGASAGNINSLLAALDYCHDWNRRISAEESLFWQTWMPVGMRQLMPRSRRVRPDEYGLADREFYDSVLFKPLEQALARKPVEEKCELPIGASITRVVSDTFTVPPSLSIRVSRHIGTYRVARKSDGSGLSLLQSKSTVRTDSSLGRQISLSSNMDGTIRFADLADLVKAAHAVPYVFGPVELKYYYSASLKSDAQACAPNPRHGDGCSTPLTGRFADGGAIDNIPLVAGIRLLALAKCTGEAGTKCGAVTDEEAESRLILYVSPGSKREALDSQEKVTVGDPGGISALQQLASNIWGSASQYELQSLARMRTIAGIHLGGELDGTTRAHPIIGEQFKHFAAFLGRAFREYDFFVGAYDGMHYLAQYLCTPRSRHKYHLAGLQVASDSVSIACMDSTFAQVYETLDVGCKGTALIPLLYSREHPLERTPELPHTTCDDAAKERQVEVLRILDQAIVAPKKFPNCRSRDAIWNQLCSSGLLGVIEAMEPRLKPLKDDIRKDCRQVDPTMSWGAYRCFIDDLQFAMLGDPRKTVTSLVLEILDRAPRVEDALGDARLPEKAGLLEVGSSLGYSLLTTSRRDFHWDPSSIPSSGVNPWWKFASSSRWFMSNVFPNVLDVSVLRVGWSLSRVPTWYLYDEWALVLPFGGGYYRDLRKGTIVDDSPYTGYRYFFLEGGVTRNIGLKGLLDACTVTGGFWWIRDLPDPKYGAFGLSCDAALRKLRLAVSYLPNVRDVGPRWHVRLGLNDFNGLLYWIGR